ncbi:MAG: hypothetical protein MUC50_22160 [Myxococcota bacterium]|jgi:hypothetical protein|nr:hypothetical protein [Myxococcota bacterium]
MKHRGVYLGQACCWLLFFSVTACGRIGYEPFEATSEGAGVDTSSSVDVDSHSDDHTGSDSDTDVETTTDDTDVETTTDDTDVETATDDTMANGHVSVGAQAEEYNVIIKNIIDRAWYVITAESTPALVDVDDNSHALSAHGGAYLEALPDLRNVIYAPQDDGSGLVEEPELAPQLGFFVNLEVARRYYVWVRGYSTDIKGQDNSIHVGLDGAWPDSGKKLMLPERSGAWVWSSNQRDSGGTEMGIPLTIYLDIESPGQHLITFAMREDGFEFDEWFMTTDPDVSP